MANYAMATTFMNHVQRVISQQGAPLDHSAARAESSHGFRADAWSAETLERRVELLTILSTQHSEQPSWTQDCSSQKPSPQKRMTSPWRIKGFCRLEPFVIISTTKDLIIHAHSDPFQRAKFRRIWGNFGEWEFGGLIWGFLNWCRNRVHSICILVWICRWCFSWDRFCAKGNDQSLALLGFYFWQWKANESAISSLLLTAQRQVSPGLFHIIN